MGANPPVSGEYQELAVQADTFGEKIKLMGEALAKVLWENVEIKKRLNEM